MTRFYPGMSVQETVEIVAPKDIATVTVESRPTSSSGQTDLLTGEQWGWEQLRDYVNRCLDERWGARPHDVLKESGIFKGFVKRWGSQAEAIARCAFEVHNGVWRTAPISVGRFTAGSDPYFAAVIAKNLE